MVGRETFPHNQPWQDSHECWEMHAHTEKYGTSVRPLFSCLCSLHMTCKMIYALPICHVDTTEPFVRLYLFNCSAVSGSPNIFCRVDTTYTCLLSIQLTQTLMATILTSYLFLVNVEHYGLCLVLNIFFSRTL